VTCVVTTHDFLDRKSDTGSMKRQSVTTQVDDCVLRHTVLHASTWAIIKQSFVMKIIKKILRGIITFSDSHTAVCYKTHKQGLRRC